MPYIKLLTVLAGLALLTACGGAAATKTADNGDNTTPTGPCVTNPFGDDCTAPTPEQELVFCRDEGKTTDTKTDDCAPTVRLVCTANVFDDLCTAPTQQEAEVFCGDVTKTTTTKPADCADTIKTACVDFFHSLCTAEVYVQQRNNFNSMCINQEGKTPQICEAEALARTCDADEFVTGCVAQKYVVERRMTCMGEKTSTRCMPTVELICGTNGNSLDDFCTDIPAYYPAQKLACATGQDDRIETACQPTIARICTNGDIFDDFCTGLPNIDTMRIADCIMAGNAGDMKCDTIVSDSTMNTAITDCLENPFATACESVSAFTTFALARTNRLTFCNDNMNVANTLCTGANLMGVCGSDPFNAICFTDKTYLPMRLTECIKTENTEGNMKCNTLLSDATMNTTITACLANPFSSACEADSDFMTYAETAQTNRGSFCDMAGNDTKALCMGANLMGVCGIDSFHAICFTDKTYLPERLGECIKTENTEDMRCNTLLSDSTMNTAITACLTNPFTDDCASNTDFMTYAGDARTNRVSFCGTMGNESKAPCTALTTCQDNLFDPTCGAYFEPERIMHCMNNNDVADCPNVTFGDWVASFTTAPPATTPTTGTPKNEFLQATGGTLPTGDLTNSDGSVITVVPKLTLNANDGVAFFQGYSGNSATEYAGIFDTTDLGAPFTEDAPSAKWNGQFQAVGAGSFPIKTDFLLEVTFGMDVNVPGSVGSIDAFVSAGSTFHYLIEGTFNGTGVIKGTVSSGLFTGDDQNTPTNALEGGVLTGLIGAEGAVGAFYTNAMLTSGASGGFIAAPTAPDTEPLVVNHGDWLRDFFKPPPATRAASSAGTDTFGGFLNLASDVRAISETGFEANSVIKGTLTLDGDGTDGMHGVTYLGGGDANNNRQAFGAVLPTTNLGAPLVSPPTTTTWPGKYYNITFGNAQVIPFVIDFSGKSITATHTDVTMATTNFALRFIPATGVITGTVTRSGTATARGLIGTNGLVGVYVDTTTGRSTGDSVLFGGFIADNPDN